MNAYRAASAVQSQEEEPAAADIHPAGRVVAPVRESEPGVELVQVVVVDRHLGGVLDPDLVLIDGSGRESAGLPLEKGDDRPGRHRVHVDEMVSAVSRRHVIEIHVLHRPDMAAIRGRVHVAPWDDGRHFGEIGRWARKHGEPSARGELVVGRFRLPFSEPGSEDAGGEHDPGDQARGVLALPRHVCIPTVPSRYHVARSSRGEARRGDAPRGGATLCLCRQDSSPPS